MPIKTYVAKKKNAFTRVHTLEVFSTLDLNICSDECSNVQVQCNTALEKLCHFVQKKAEIRYIPHNALLDKPSSLTIGITEANKETNLLESLYVQFLPLVQS